MLLGRVLPGVRFNDAPLWRSGVSEPGSQTDDDGLRVSTSMPELLLADDEPGVRRIVMAMLKPLGCVIHEAADGDDAVEQFLAEPHRFRTMILDIRMPRRSGIEVLQTVHAIRPDLPVFLITGSPERVPEKLLRSNVELILKPFRGPELRSAIGPKLRPPAPSVDH